MTSLTIQRSVNMLLTTSNTEKDLVALINQYKDHCNYDGKGAQEVDDRFARLVVKRAYRKLASFG